MSNDTTPTFADLGVPHAIAKILSAAGFDAPFDIQAETLADTLEGRDLAGEAPTGSGKTLAFSIPVAARVGRGTSKRPRALLLAPTRELANQITEELRPLLAARQRSVATFIGGTSINKDRTRLNKGVDVIVGCPGRLEDLVQRRWLDLRDVDIVVVDEADRMADMGFIRPVSRLIDATARDRQVMLFSATLEGEVDLLVREFQHDPIVHRVAADDEERGDVDHKFIEVEQLDKRHMVASLCKDSGSVIVFTRTKRRADRLAKQLGTSGVKAAAIHGDRSQGQRERALEQFGRGQVQVLVATDIAARGIHVDDVDLVVHYDIPATHTDYVHRSGRTGRAGRDGRVVALSTAEQRKDLATLQRDLGGLIGDVAMPEHGTGSGSSGKPRNRNQQKSRPKQGGKPKKQYGPTSDGSNSNGGGGNRTRQRTKSTSGNGKGPGGGGNRTRSSNSNAKPGGGGGRPRRG